MASAISAMTSIFGRPIEPMFAPTCRLKLCSSKWSKSASVKRPMPRRVSASRCAPPT